MVFLRIIFILIHSAKAHFHLTILSEFLIR